MTGRDGEQDDVMVLKTKRPALAQVVDHQRAALRAEARRDAARRELAAARDEVQEARTALWQSVREAWEDGATLADIASVMGVSIQRVSALMRKPEQAARR